MRNRIQITDVIPLIDAGRYPVKAVVGERVHVSALLFREGHDLVAGAVRYRMLDDATWSWQPLDNHGGDHFAGSFPVDRNGRWVYQVVGWTDHWATWLDGLIKKHRAGVTDLEVELADGVKILAEHAAPMGIKGPPNDVLNTSIKLLGDRKRPVRERVDAARSTELTAVLRARPDRRDATDTGDLPLWVDRERAGFSTWYEFFPRSIGSDGVRSGTFTTAATRLPDIAAMGFDVVYLPPIHPIGIAHRKGPNNTLKPGPGDPGVPWAIGGAAGGHKSVHPDLGTLEDFDDFVAAAAAEGLEVALDFAIQCSPDHPWVTEHPTWFKHRSDGSIQYAENPPKKYQDIYPIDFDTPDIEGLQAELKSVVDFWVARGVKIFRVDNPHTKALPFWEWLITQVQSQDPEVLFLAEAFTKPAMMHQLAKLGFSQSYTYFTWRTSKHDLTTYMQELAHTASADYFRPNFWPNTPDILHAYLQSGAPSAFKVRYGLAGLLSPNMGVYSGYELLEHVPVRNGSEEYMDSEKYAYRPRNFDVEHSIAPFMTRINTIRREHRSLFGDLRNIHFHHIDNDNLLAFSKANRDLGEAILVVVNLDPFNAQEGWTWIDVGALGVPGDGASYDVEDLLSSSVWTWHGNSNWVRLDPHHGEPLHILRIRPHQ